MRTSQGGAPSRGGVATAAIPHPAAPPPAGRSAPADEAATGRVHHPEAPPAQRGSVTAEVAVVLPALVVLLALLLGTAHVGIAQLRLEEAARAGAREAMRGEGADRVESTVQRLAGEHATTTVTSGSGWTTVEVRASVDGPLVGSIGLELRASASGREESGG